MQQPPGFVDATFPSYVCKLNKAIYGLKQAPRAWFNELQSCLVNYGISYSRADSSLFILTKGPTLLYLLVYVDDLILTGNDNVVVSQFVTSLSQRFSMKDLGPLKHFLGIEVLPTSTGLFLSQQQYLQTLLTKTHMHQSKPLATPMFAPTSFTSSATGHFLPSATFYCQIVGGLQYLTFTRPDIVFTVNKLSQYMHCPTYQHWVVVKHILCYLNGTVSFGISLHR